MPGGGFAGIAGVESGRAAPLVGGPPGVELHTVFEGLPSGFVGEMFPVVVMPTGVGMVPNAAGIVAVDDIVVVGAIIVAVVPGMDVETVVSAVDDAGAGIAVMEGAGRGGTAAGCGPGMVVPGKSVMNDVAGCADSGRFGVAVLPMNDVVAVLPETTGSTSVLGPKAVLTPLKRDVCFTPRKQTSVSYAADSDVIVCYRGAKGAGKKERVRRT